MFLASMKAKEVHRTMPSRTVQQSSQRRAPRWIPRQRSQEDPPIDREPDNDHGITMGPDRQPEPLERRTRMGTPDRRFKGQRDLPEPRLGDYKPARTGGVVDEVHVTLDGRPDRRFKENRSLSDEEVLETQIAVLQAQRNRH
jgi:hypothetical protein